MTPFRRETAHAFVLAWVDGRWCLGVVDHPIRGLMVLPADAVAPDEGPADTALRAVRTLTGLTARHWPVKVDVPDALGLLVQPAPAPWWTFESDRDDRIRFTVDHLFVVLVDHPGGAMVETKPFAWFDRATIQADNGWLFPDTRRLALALFDRIDDLTSPGFGQPESIGAAFKRLGIGPGDYVTAEQFPKLPQWFLDRQAAAGHLAIARHEAQQQAAASTT